jgi:hypothetical protein
MYANDGDAAPPPSPDESDRGEMPSPSPLCATRLGGMRRREGGVVGGLGGCFVVGAGGRDGAAGSGRALSESSSSSLSLSLLMRGAGAWEGGAGAAVESPPRNFTFCVEVGFAGGEGDSPSSGERVGWEVMAWRMGERFWEGWFDERERGRGRERQRGERERADWALETFWRAEKVEDLVATRRYLTSIRPTDFQVPLWHSRPFIPPYSV